MARQFPADECELTCIWQGTDMCLRHLVTGRGLAQRHLGLGMLQGLKSLYYPGELPPCVNFKGDIEWHRTVDEPLEVQEAWL
jgi:hypothetical protein